MSSTGVAFFLWLGDLVVTGLVGYVAIRAAITHALRDDRLARRREGDW